MPENDRGGEQLLHTLGSDLLSLLPDSIKRLQLALQAKPFTQETLPATISSHWHSHDNAYRITVYPSENINDNDALRRFVHAVQQIVPNATGAPVISLEAGEAVVDAFYTCFLSGAAGCHIDAMDDAQKYHGYIVGIIDPAIKKIY